MAANTVWSLLGVKGLSYDETLFRVFFFDQLSFKIMSIDVTGYVTIENFENVFTWRHGGHIGVPKQRNGGHVCVPNQSYGSWTLFLCKCFLLFQLIGIETGHTISNFLTSCQRLTPL